MARRSLINNLVMDLNKRKVAAVWSKDTRLLDRLSRDPEQEVRKGVARNPHTPADILNRLSKDPSHDIRWWVAEYPRTIASQEALARLGRDSSRKIRLAVAGNHYSPRGIMDRLSRSPDSVIRREVAGNPSTPLDILDRLISDKQGHVRGAVARNPSASLNILNRLSKDPEIGVIKDLAENPSASLNILNRLKQDRAISDWYFRRNPKWQERKKLEKMGLLDAAMYAEKWLLNRGLDK
tara:strand:- start:11921 stop:12634 length:714 start_codon:yes stop_codon:yes gene_type:complete